MRDEALSLLSLAAKAGKLADGEFKAMEAIKKHRAYLVILAEDATAGTIKKFKDKAKTENVPVVFSVKKEILGRTIGKEDRAVIALLDRGFGESLRKKLTEHPGEQ